MGDVFCRMKSKTIIFCLTALLLPVFLHAAAAQEEPDIGSAAEPVTVLSEPGEGTVASLEALERSLDITQQEIDAAQQRLVDAQDDVSREEARAKLIDLKNQYEEQRRQFEEFAVEIDLRPFITEEEKAFDWQEELAKLLEPIMAEIENATAESRQIGELRSRLSELGEKRDLAEEAVRNLESLMARDLSTNLASRLQERLDAWQRTYDQAKNEYTALDLQLQNRLAEQKSFIDSSTAYAQKFFRTKGLNLLLGILAFCAVFFGVRFLQYVVRKLKRGKEKKNFGTRLTALLFHVFSIAGGLLATLAVFNMVGDWFLLGIIVIFLLGVGWASINTLPQHVETVKLMLNIGAVKEGERLMFDGTPFRVESLGFAAREISRRHAFPSRRRTRGMVSLQGGRLGGALRRQNRAGGVSDPQYRAARGAGRGPECLSDIRLSCPLTPCSFHQLPDPFHIRRRL